MMNLSQTKLVGLTMELDLKTREYKKLCDKLDELKEINKQQTGNPDMVVFPRLVKLKEAAKYLGVSATTLHGYINDGKLKRYKFGRRNARITAESLKNLLQDSEH